MCTACSNLFPLHISLHLSIVGQEINSNYHSKMDSICACSKSLTMIKPTSTSIRLQVFLSNIIKNCRGWEQIICRNRMGSRSKSIRRCSWIVRQLGKSLDLILLFSTNRDRSRDKWWLNTWKTIYSPLSARK